MPDINTDSDDGLLTIARYCEVYDSSRSHVYELLATGELQAVKDGRLTKITVASARTRAARLRPFESKARSAA